MKQFDQIVLRMRMQPFKTSFTPDFAIDWGNEKSPEIGYPEREKRPVQVFDVREFVKQKRQEKIKSMMMDNDSPSSGGSPFDFGNKSSFSGNKSPFGASPFKDEGSSPFGASPFGGFGSNKEETPKPKPMETSKPEKSSAQSVDIDELVKKIDAKIAEMEKEEKEEKEETKKVETPTPEVKVEKKVEEEVIEKPVYKETRKEETIPYISSQSIEDKVNQIIRNQRTEEEKPVTIEVAQPVFDQPKAKEVQVSTYKEEPVTKPTSVVEAVTTTYEPKVEEVKQTIVEQPKKVIVETQQAVQNTTNEVVDNKPKLSLDDVSETEFFDDFFED
jgi:hypothetical protein